jgi:hypothetical protein
MASDAFLPFAYYPTSEDAGESFVVRGREVGPFIEISLSRDRHHTHGSKRGTFEPLELLAMKRFGHQDMAGYTAYAGNLESAASLAARGQLGYSVDTELEGGVVRISLIARLMAPDGRVHTEITHEQSFDDPDSEAALVQANEQATELRANAEQLNDDLATTRAAALEELRAEYDKADEQADAAAELQRIVDSE